MPIPCPRVWLKILSCTMNYVEEWVYVALPVHRYCREYCTRNRRPYFRSKTCRNGGVKFCLSVNSRSWDTTPVVISTFNGQSVSNYPIFVTYDGGYMITIKYQNRLGYPFDPHYLWLSGYPTFASFDFGKDANKPNPKLPWRTCTPSTVPVCLSFDPSVRVEIQAILLDHVL